MNILNDAFILKENSIYKKLTCITAGLESYAIIRIYVCFHGI